MVIGPSVIIIMAALCQPIRFILKMWRRQIICMAKKIVIYFIKISTYNAKCIYKGWIYLHPVRHHFADLGKRLGGNFIKFKGPGLDSKCLLWVEISQILLGGKWFSALHTCYGLCFLLRESKLNISPHLKQHKLTWSPPIFAIAFEALLMAVPMAPTQ